MSSKWKKCVLKDWDKSLKQKTVVKSSIEETAIKENEKNCRMTWQSNQFTSVLTFQLHFKGLFKVWFSQKIEKRLHSHYIPICKARALTGTYLKSLANGWLYFPWHILLCRNVLHLNMDGDPMRYIYLNLRLKLIDWLLINTDRS